MVLDLRFDDSYGIEYSLILFHFPRNVLLGIIINPSTLQCLAKEDQCPLEGYGPRDNKDLLDLAHTLSGSNRPK